MEQDQDWVELIEREELNPAEVVAWTRTPEGRLVWLEQGNLNAGLAHIVERHGSEFVGLGIPVEELPELLMQALREGEQIAVQGRDRSVYRFQYRGQDWYVAITVGDNGFVLGANPFGQRKLRQWLRRQNAPKDSTPS